MLRCVRLVCCVVLLVCLATLLMFMFDFRAFSPNLAVSSRSCLKLVFFNCWLRILLCCFLLFSSSFHPPIGLSGVFLFGCFGSGGVSILVSGGCLGVTSSSPRCICCITCFCACCVLNSCW